ncbi:MAG: type II toxin-antitoxin system HicB family antitoxin [Pseudonocardiaceae bacterium]
MTAAIYQEGAGYVARCLELDVVSQGDTIEEAKANLVEAIELLFEDPADWRAIDPAPAIVPIEVRIPGDLQATA